MKRRLLSAALALTALSACATSPIGPPPSSGSSSRIGTLMEIGVIDRGSGLALPIYRARGDYWVAGRPGARYAIRVRNAMGERVMAVMSVDGVNVVTGETADTGQTGYVFERRERSDIAGWRKSDSQIAAFEFAAAGNAYASRTGRPDHVGVIGVAMFREREPAPPAVPMPSPRREGYGERERRSESPATSGAGPSPAPPSPSGAKSRAADSAVAAESASAGLSARQAAPSPSLGTAHGRRETSYVGHTEFERAGSTPDEVVRIRYDSRENLIAAGVIPVARPAGPSPFPGADPGYVPDPPSRY